MLVVSGTGTGVGKTVVTAALAALAVDRGASVAVVKPPRPGSAPTSRATWPPWRSCPASATCTSWHASPTRCPPTPPPAGPACRRSTWTRPAGEIHDLGCLRDLVLVEGAGGLLVRYDTDGATLADVARALGAPVLVVAEAGLGTLNHTALTLEVLANRGIRLEGLVVGAWPTEPDLAARSNLTDLEALAARPLSGALPAGAGSLDRVAFLTIARASLGPGLGGAFDAAEFARTHR